jgi:hypothetical protein
VSIVGFLVDLAVILGTRQEPAEAISDRRVAGAAEIRVRASLEEDDPWQSLRLFIAGAHLSRKNRESRTIRIVMIQRRLKLILRQDEIFGLMPGSEVITNKGPEMSLAECSSRSVSALREVRGETFVGGLWCAWWPWARCLCWQRQPVPALLQRHRRRVVCRSRRA